MANHTSPRNYHKHRCNFCAFVWEHHDVNDVRHGEAGAHECPACHRCNWSLGIYAGDEPPRVRNGTEPVTPTPVVEMHRDQVEGY
jgi:hypothetical protein